MTDNLYMVYLIKGAQPLFYLSTASAFFFTFLPFYFFTFKELSLFPAPASSSV